MQEALLEFANVVYENTMAVPSEIVLPQRAFDRLAKELEPVCVYVASPPGEIGITLNTVGGTVLIRRGRG